MCKSMPPITVASDRTRRGNIITLRKKGEPGMTMPGLHPMGICPLSGRPFPCQAGAELIFAAMPRLQ
jgi:hypothetical protein